MGITSHVTFLIFSLAGWVQRLSSSVGGSKLINKFLPSNYIQSKKWIYAFQLIILIFSFSIDIYSQITDSLNRSKFIKLEDKWYAVDGDDRFRVDDSVITVKWKPNISKEAIDDFNKKEGLTIIRENILGFVHLKVERPTEVLQIVKNYLNSGLVEIAEPNTFGFLGSIPGPGEPNDTHFGKQWYLDDDWDYDINAPEAWNITTGSPSVIVGILDTGVDWLHEDLGMGTDGYQNVWVNTEEAWSDPNDPTSGDSIDNDGNGYIDDYKGWNFCANSNDNRGNVHGTLIAGLIAAKTNNNKGVAGVAGGWGGSGVKVLITKVTTSQSFDNDSVQSAFIGDAILYAVDKGAKVINMSFYAHYDNSSMNSAINYAYNHGCVLVAPAGNGYPELPIWYPARRPEFIAVTGTKKDGSAFPSCAGINPVYQNPVSISAPAGTNLSLEIDPIDWHIYGLQPGNGYYYYGYGGCYSSAIVSGVVGLMLSVRPNLTPAQVRCVLEKTATDMDTVGWDPKFGWGRVNAYRALQAIIIKLISPPNNSIASLYPTLYWSQLYGATSYRVQAAKNSNFINPIFDQSGITTTFISLDDLTPHTDYYWHVKADNDLCNVTAWSETWKFTAEHYEKIAVQQIEDESNSFYLSDNFPEPFNPSTKISYALPKDEYVVLKVFDVLGREIATIVNEHRTSGWHDVYFNVSNLPSGVYYYKIQAGRFVAVKKMIVSK